MVLEFVGSKSLGYGPPVARSRMLFCSISIWVAVGEVLACSSPTNPANPPESGTHTEASAIRSKQGNETEPLKSNLTNSAANKLELKSSIAPTNPSKSPSTEEDNSTTLVLTDSAQWSDVRLELWSSNRQCEIRTTKDRETQRFQLEMTPPCHLVRRNGKLQSFAYPKQNLKGVALISGTPPEPDPQLQRRLDRLGDRGKDCGYETQAILFYPNEMKLAAKVMRRVLMCPTIGADEIYFADFAGVPPGR